MSVVCKGPTFIICPGPHEFSRRAWHHIMSARSRKQNKPDYLQLLAELDRLQISNYYETLEISVLGHYHPSTIQNIKRFTDFIIQLSVTSTIRQIHDSEAKISVTCSQMIFMAWHCSIWSTDSLM